MRRDIEFTSEGARCRGWLYVPERRDPPHPGVVMAHGFGAVKEMYLEGIAKRFCEAGFAVLVFDYRFFGSSEGEPRGRVYPSDQQEDYRSALSWFSEQPEVDPDRLGIWGTSYGGGHVIEVATLDRRVKAVVAQVPLIDGWRNAHASISLKQFGDLLDLLQAERERRYQTGETRFLKIVAPDDELAILAAPEAHDWFRKASARAPTWENQVTADSIERFLSFHPASVIERVSPTPLLLIVAAEDLLAPAHIALEAYERALEPKDLLLLQCRHFDVYDGPWRDDACAAAIDWFEEYL